MLRESNHSVAKPVFKMDFTPENFKLLSNLTAFEVGKNSNILTLRRLYFYKCGSEKSFSIKRLHMRYLQNAKVASTSDLTIVPQFPFRLSSFSKSPHPFIALSRERPIRRFTLDTTLRVHQESHLS